MSRVQVGNNDLFTTNPELAKEWHPTKNGSLLPTMVSFGTHRKVWWKCKQGHEWEAMVSNRARLGRKCPYCTHQKILPGQTDLATTNPKLAKEWHPNKNNGLTPSDVFAGTHKVVWWQCKQGHEWRAEIKSRNAGVGCPYCEKKGSIKKPTVGVNDFETVHPKIAKEWHPTKNGDLRPSQFTYGSGKIVWWICKNRHEYQKAIVARHAGKGCPICAQRRRTSFPEQAVYYYIHKAFPDAINGYRDIFSSSMELDVYIPSLKVGIEYDGRVFHTSQSNVLRDAKKYQICKAAGIRLIRIRECTHDSLVTRYDNKIDIPDASDKYLDYAISYLLYKLEAPSDVNVRRDRAEILSNLEAIDTSLKTEYPLIAKEWHPTKNGKLKPEMFHQGSNEKVWWQCSICGCEWKTSIAERTGNDKTGCPNCSASRGAKKRLDTIINKNGSLMKRYPYLIKEWNWERNKDIDPSEVTVGSGKKFWWKCSEGHEWEATVGDRVNGRGCPYCANKKILRGYNDFATKHPELMEEWDFEKNVDISPFEIPSRTGKKAWWICKNCGNSWQSVVASRSNGVGCPACAIKQRRKFV